MTTSPSPDVARRWWADGELVVAGLVDRLGDEELAADSALPGWSRAHVVAHLARNADALVNLLTWARTGVETPMYPSRAVRDADIETTAALPGAGCAPTTSPPATGSRRPSRACPPTPGRRRCATARA